MINLLVETKNEYTTQLINIFSPLIYEGVVSIYKEAEKISSPNDVLKTFQLFLKRVPKWNNEMIISETDRIINNTKSFGWLEDLVKATMKANIIVLMFNPNVPSGQGKVDPKYYQDIKISDFVHKVYIECAREFWNNPYLLYHNFPPIELKRNQREAILLIKDCIREAIRKLLPVKHILQMYLGEELEVQKPDDKFEKTISEIEEKNLTKLIKKDLGYSEDKQKSLPLLEPNKELQNIFEEAQIKENDIMTPKKPTQNISEETIGSKILNKIHSDKNDSITSSEINKILSIKPKEPENLDMKINTLLKDLGDNPSDVETSINYSQEPDNKYQEIFSNSIIEKNPKQESNIEQQQDKEKRKYFNKFLQL